MAGALRNIQLFNSKDSEKNLIIFMNIQLSE